MDKKITLTEGQLRNLIQQSIKESLDEVNWFQRTGQKIRNGFDNVKNQVGGAAAGLKAGVKYGGTNAASAGRNDYLAKKNNELAQSRQAECDAAVAEFRKEYGARVGELNRWKANEIRQIKQMYGADAFAKKAQNAASSADAARNDQANFWQYDRNAASAAQNNQQRMVAEAIEGIVDKVLNEYIA